MESSRVLLKKHSRSEEEFVKTAIYKSSHSSNLWLMAKVNFQGSGAQLLAARLDEPDGDPHAYVLFAHAFSSSKDIFAASRIAKALQSRGYAVLRFDFTGLGESEGDFANTNFSSNIWDIVAAATFLRQNYEPPSLMVGHSLGGSAVLSAAKHIPEVKAVATIGSPADVAHVAHHFDDERDEILEKGEAEVSLGGRPFKIRKQFIEDIEGTKIEDSVKNLKKALLVMHAPLDQTVGIENAGKIFSWAKHPKSYVSLDDADHLITGKEHAEYAGRMIATWARKYV